MTTSELATDVADYLQSIGARRLSRSGIRCQTFEIPCGIPDERNRRPFLRVNVTLRPLRCEINVDRWNAKDAPEQARPWFEPHLWPKVWAAAERSRRGCVFLPGGGSYDSATVLAEDVLPVLREWIPQEIAWQEAPAR